MTKHSRLVWLGLLCLLLLGSSVHADESLSGAWHGADWGEVVISGNRGSYTDTYKTGPGTFEFKSSGKNTYAGTWGESKQRFGTLSFKTLDDGKRIVGTYRADPGCTINPGNGGDFQWTKKK